MDLIEFAADKEAQARMKKILDDYNKGRTGSYDGTAQPSSLQSYLIYRPTFMERVAVVSRKILGLGL